MVVVVTTVVGPSPGAPSSVAGAPGVPGTPGAGVSLLITSSRSIPASSSLPLISSRTPSALSRLSFAVASFSSRVLSAPRLDFLLTLSASISSLSASTSA